LKIREALLWARARLEGRVENPSLEAEILVRSLLRISREELWARESEVPEEKLRETVELRMRRYPLQYITGMVEFFSRNFLVKEGVFIPRPETETLVEVSLGVLKAGDRVVEVGTGTGVVAITLALERPGLRIFADDINPTAVALAKENAQRLGARVSLLVGDCLLPFRGRFHAVVSNPPYVAPGEEVSPELSYEPREAYLAPPDGLSLIRRLLLEARRVLLPGGKLIMEISPRHGKFLREEYGAKIFPDLFQRPRVALIVF